MKRSRKLINLILLGDIASGKGTQAARLAKRYGLYDFDMGKELRKPANRSRHDFSHTTGRGRLTPTWLVREILYRKIRTLSPRRGILFDGTPKMIGEAKLVSKWLAEFGRGAPLVLYITIPHSEIIKRVERGRKYRGENKIFREDDALEAIRNRLAYYETQIPKVVSFFKKRYVFKKVSGLGTRGEVFRRIVTWIESQRERATR